MRPLIAISTEGEAPENPHTGSPSFHLERPYVDAVCAAGGLPILVPLVPDRALLWDLMERCDGLLLAGSRNDVDPRRYGQSPRTRLNPVVPEQDETAWLLLEAAQAHRRPILAICYGMHLLNVFRGGTLYQDISSQRENTLRHEPGASHEELRHRIRIEEGTVLARLAGGTTAEVTSFHHQAVERLGQGLRAIAWSEDGIIEAVIDTASDLLWLGLQWHPEIGFASDRFSQAIFNYFLHEAARKHT